MLLVAIALTCMSVGIGKNDYKYKAIADFANTLIMLILLVVNIIEGNVVWVIICGVFAIFDMLALTYDLTKCNQDTGKTKESRNTLDDTKSVLKEFIKEIEEYGSTRH
jgi:hypothetical protein